MNTLAAAATHPRILVVDDELGPRESLRMLLKPVYQIQTAENGRAALEALHRFRPDVVIMDVKMPEMDGLELLRQVKRADPSIEVVMITAYASLETVKLALTHGAFEYLIKPFSRQDMEDVVRRALLRRQADLGARSQVATLVEEMRQLASKTRELEEAARREAAEQSLRVTQLSILREISRAIVGQLDTRALTAAVTAQLSAALGYDQVAITLEAPGDAGDAGAAVVVCAIRDLQGPLGHLVVDNRASGRAIDPRERELLEMLSEYLAIALRNSRLYGEIADTKRSLEQLIASAGDAIISVTADDLVDGWNPAAARVFGLSSTQALGRAVAEFLPADEYGDAKRRLAAGQPMHQFETAPAGSGGRPAALAVTLSALRGRDGALDGLIAIVRDITAQREIEGQLHQSEKLTALGQLAGGIAHDFNNLLQAILGYAQLMKQHPNDPAFLDRSLKIVEAAAVDGSETVRRIQQFARLRPDEQFVPVDVNQIVQDTVAITRPRWEEKIAHDNRPLDLRLALGSVPSINGRPAALTELMTNLILNALDAMPDGGTLTIATRHERGAVVVTVADTGVGMSETVRQRIFEPFFSTKGEAGSGLGLSMSYSIVRRHGGEIRVESEEGRGTTFSLTFHVAQSRAAAGAPAASGAGRRAARVLVVDDDSKVLATLTELLRSVGHAVTAAPSGAAALEAYAPGRFDVVLTNLGMAGMNGWEFAERLRAVDRAVPLLLITGWGLRGEDHGRLGALGIRRCLFKPVRPEDLDAAVQDALAAP
ncbi:MAG: response regulator [Candidatus Rokubacteria bacterium]|nr:response regulator [Candidatus Rokubacteria bacterium]MBI2156838.1 response regulator [Candidatus Rokubacteria bacterium]